MKWAYVAEGLKCDKCKSSTSVRPLDLTNYQDRKFIRAYHLQDLDKIENDENYIDLTKDHRKDLCEKCQRLGRPCRKTPNRETPSRELRQRTNRTSRSVTPSSTPYRAFLTVPEITTALPASYYTSDTVPQSTMISSARSSAKASPSMNDRNLQAKQLYYC